MQSTHNADLSVTLTLSAAENAALTNILRTHYGTLLSTSGADSEARRFIIRLLWKLKRD